MYTLDWPTLSHPEDEIEIHRVRFGLSVIDKMPRWKLLQAHGWGNGKTNTQRLRSAARKRFLANDPNFYIWV